MVAMVAMVAMVEMVFYNTLFSAFPVFKFMSGDASVPTPLSRGDDTPLP